MSKKKTIKNINKNLTSNHIYDLGGDLKKILQDKGTQGALINALSAGLNPLISNGLSSTTGTAISGVGSTIGSAISTVNPLLGGIVTGGSQLVGGLTNAAFGSNINQGNVASIEANNASLGNTTFAGNYDAVQNQLSSLNLGNSFTKSDIGSDGWFSNKAQKKYNELVNAQNLARSRALSSFNNAVSNIESVNNANMMSNYKAYGGDINIKPSKKGTFTAAAKKHNKSVQEFASQVLANKENYSPAMVKKANFARNASKWKHSEGGNLILDNNFSNGLTFINTGGTHEENPMEGVPMGVAPDGSPNLVEQGEVIYNDYVMSNRLSPSKEDLASVGLPLTYKDHTYAYIAKKLGEESKERPNDPISKRGLEDSMNKLATLQEMQRARNNKKGTQQLMAFGGRKYAGDENTVFSIPKIDNIGLNKAIQREVDSILQKDYTKPLTRPYSIHSESSNDFTPYLRYAPVIGAGIGLAQNLFSKPDYSSADRMVNVANELGNYTPISYSPIGNYLTYTPFDRNYHTNTLNAQSGATRRAIMNSSSPSRNAALLAADYNAQNQLGALAKQAEEYNLAQRQAVEQFNRATNQANAEMALKTDMANQEAQLKSRQAKLSTLSQAEALRDAIDNRRANSLSANLTNLFDNLGNVGIDAYNRKDRDMLINSGIFGTLSQKPQEWSDEEWDKYRLDVLDSMNKSKANGGKLKKKKRGGFTY